ncbi:MAG: hypothetical protein Q7O12_09300 [Deltaproteobacteria bacterium]|nr:hypothetical protein [Deltaproteobacteria bacterium]
MTSGGSDAEKNFVRGAGDVFFLTGVAVYAATMPDIQAHKNGKYCGMDREKFVHSFIVVAILLSAALRSE